MYASLELSRGLYEVSRWGFDLKKDHQGDLYVVDRQGKSLGLTSTGGFSMAEMAGFVPAYSLGYLLRKLPAKHQMIEGDVVELTLRKEENVIPAGVRYLAYYAASEDSDCWCKIADTPEDAACKLAIELFKQGILKPTTETEGA